jgi:hypothetical protein
MFKDVHSQDAVEKVVWKIEALLAIAGNGMYAREALPVRRLSPGFG